MGNASAGGLAYVPGGGGTGGGVGVSLSGNTSGALANVSSGTLYFAGGNNITLSQNGQSVTISGANAGGAQTGISSVIVSNATYSSGAVSFSNANGFSFGSSAGQAITGSYTVPSQVSLFALGNTTQNSSTALPFNALSFNGLGEASVGFSNGSIQVSMPPSSVGVSGGNTSGTSGNFSGQVVFAGGNNITLSVVTGAAGAQSITISGAAAGGAQTAVSGIVVSNTTYTSGTVSFSNANGISFGSSAGQAITASYTVPSTAGLISGMRLSAGGGTSNTGVTGLTFSNSNNITFGLLTGVSVGTLTASFSQSNQNLSLFALGNTTQNSSTVLAAGALSFNGLGEASVGFSNGSIQVSMPPSSIGVSGGNTSGTSGTFSGQVAFAGGNNITLSVATAAGGAQSITISGANAGNAASLFALGNTTQNSSSAMSLSALSFNGLGAQTVGFSNGSIQLSVPATSSLVGTNGISVSVNASTISVSLLAVSRSIWPQAQVSAISAPGMGSLSIQYYACDVPLTASRLDALVGWSASSTASAVTAAIAMSAWAIIYTKNASTLSSLSSGSTQTTYSYASNTAGNTQLISAAIRPVSVPMNMAFTQGEYFIGFNFSTAASSIGAATTNLAQALSVYGGNQLQTASNFAEFTAVTATSTNLYGGMGVYTAATAGAPVSIGLANIAQTGASLAQANIALVFRNV